MKIFKFGGASVKDAAGVKNLVTVLEKVGYKDTLVVVSAMGKSTNTLEEIIEQYFQDKTKTPPALLQLKEYHFQIIDDLFQEQKTEVVPVVHELFEELHTFLKSNKSPDYSFVYDQVVSFGELLSTTIIHYFLLNQGLDSFWLDARNCIKTDDYYRAANLNWELTQSNIQSQIGTASFVITQGFIGSDSNNFTTS